MGSLAECGVIYGCVCSFERESFSLVCVKIYVDMCV